MIYIYKLTCDYVCDIQNTSLTFNERVFLLIHNIYYYYIVHILAVYLNCDSSITFVISDRYGERIHETYM